MLDGIKAVLFDLDGTLVDSMWMWGAIDVEYLGRHGLTVYPGLQQAIEGMSFSETAAYFKEQFALPDSLDVIKAEWIAMSKEKYAHEVPLKPGAREFLEYLKSHGIKAGIATSNGRELLDAVVAGQGLAPYFQCLMTSCEAGAGKPAPDIYLKVAAELGAKPEDCLVFEDTPADPGSSEMFSDILLYIRSLCALLFICILSYNRVRSTFSTPSLTLVSVMCFAAFLTGSAALATA